MGHEPMPVVEVSSREYWVKVVGMLQHNWALVDELEDGAAAIVFVNDASVVFDRLAYPSRRAAEHDLRGNGFGRHADGALDGLLAPPRPPFRDGRNPASAVYSSGRFWHRDDHAGPRHGPADALPAHRRLAFDRGPDETPDYANLYRFGTPSGPAPLLVYVGGAITREQHAARFRTAPTPVLKEVNAARERIGTERLDVLIAPSPPRGDEPGMTLLDSFVGHFQHQLLPALEGPPPPAIAFVGYSFGAHLATYLALGREDARALVTIGGAGIAEAAEAARPAVARELRIALFHNADDQLPRPAPAVRAFEARLQPRVMPPRPGGHAFRFYAANGSVADAFALALHWLTG